MFGKDTAMYGIGAGIIAVALYLLATGQQDVDRQVHKAEFMVESAKFDRDFAQARGQAELAKEAEQDLVAAREKLAKASAVAEKNQAEKTAQEKEMLQAVGQDLKANSDGRMDLDAALEEIK